MSKQFITLNDIKYLVEFNDYHKMTNKILSKYVMFRKYDIQNDIAVDTDLYFIEYNLYKQYCNNDKKIIWPIINDNNKNFSYNKFKFNNITVFEDLNQYTSDFIDTDVYFLYDSNEGTDMAYIPCDEIKIYKPINRTLSKTIIHVSNIINNINIHYFCELFENQQSIICNEIEFNNTIYNDYITFKIPNLEELFKSNTFWFKEDLNLTMDLLEYDYFNNSINALDIEHDNLNFVPTSLLIESYLLHETETGDFIKLFVKKYKTTEDNYINNAISIFLYEYDNQTSSDELINITENVGISVFTHDNTFALKSKIDFDDNGIISLINEFEYPDMKNMSLEESYFYYNKIDNPDDYYNFKGIDNDDFYEYLEDEYGDIVNLATFNAAGYYIEMATDIHFKHIIYKSQCETKTIQNFAFALNNIFNSWKQYPESLFIHALFIDKYLSKTIFGNVVVITKEHFKYFINDSKISRLNVLKNKQVNDMTNVENFNFIDKINCIVKRNSDELSSEFNINKQTNILYKPIFYKTTDVQNIKIRKNIIQNIGINLSDYLSKVTAFILEIDTIEYNEYARNDGFVIFNINSNLLASNFGYFNILNQDHEFISSGQYSIY